MDFTQFSQDDIREMLKTIGVDDVADLFEKVPTAIRAREDLNIPKGVSEMEILADIQSLAKKNISCDDRVCFLGGGAADHFIPAVVEELSGRNEFRTAYTPYQAEASQGALQAFFEYQTMICQLTGMEVSNASLYEMATAVAEAALMARNITRKKKVLIAETTHPDARTVLDTYVLNQDIDVTCIPRSGGLMDMDALTSAIDKETAAVIIQTPNYFGCIEKIDKIVEAAHAAGALVIASIDPLSCGILKNPGDFDVDIVVGEGQPLGIPLSYGGPYLGFMACREKYLRKIPGRVVGEAIDSDGKRGYCLALQTREQHIKRERATSNICTNQGLVALRAAVYLAAMGKQGIRKVSELCLDKAHYAAARITKLEGFDMAFDAPFFKEFVVRTTKDVGKLIDHCTERNILPGLPLGCWYAGMHDCLLVTVTEKRSKEDIDSLVTALESA